MTDSFDKKPKSRRSSFDADLDAMLDEAELSLTPIPELLDEDAIDRLLVDDGFDTEDEFTSTDTEKHDPIMNEMSFMDDDLIDSISEDQPDQIDKNLNDLFADEILVEDELDLKLDQLSTALDDAENIAGSIPVETTPEDLDTTSLEEVEADELDLMLDQASDELGLAAESEDDFAATSQYELIEPDMDPEQSDLSTSPVDTELDVSEGSPDEDLLALLQAQESELAQQLETELEQIRSAEPESELDIEQESEPESEPESELKPELDPELEEIITDLDIAPEQVKAENEPDDFEEAITEDDLPASLIDQISDDMQEINDLQEEDEELELIPELIDADYIEPDADELDDLVSEEDDEEAELVADIVTDLDDSSNEELTTAEDLNDLEDDSDDLIIEDDSDQEAIDEFGDDFDMEALMREAEAELADQIAADLLNDNELIADTEADLDENLPNSDFDDISGLEIIEDDADNFPVEQEVYDEFSDDELMPSNDGFSDEDSVDNLLGDEQDETPTDEEDFLLADFDITPDQDEFGVNENSIVDDVNNPFGDDTSLFDQPEGSEPDFEVEPILDNQEPPVAEAAFEEAAGLAALAAFKAEQESINKQQKKLLTDLETKSKKSDIFTYTALGFGVFALALATYLGVVAHSAKNEVTKLNEVIAGLNTKLTAIPAKTPEAPAPNPELTHKPATDEVDVEVEVDVSPEKADAEHTEKPDVDGHAKPEEKHSEITSAKHELKPSENETEDKVTEVPHKKSELDHKVGAKESADDTNKPAEKVKHDEHEKTLKIETEKAEKAEKTEKAVTVIKKKPVVEDVETPEPTAVESKKKPVFKERPVLKPLAKSEDNNVKVKAKEKKKPVKTVVSEPKPEKAINKAITNGDWSVNLIAFKQDWYAKGKAIEFRQKGVPVDVVTVNIDNVKWYRLRVSGFNGRAEASAYAGRVKKALNLSSVWVGK